MVRHWTLGGTNGSVLTETVTVSSAGKALGAAFQEAIPASIASSLQTVRFSPAPTRIVQADPVVEWQLQVPAEASVTSGYRATVPADGATHARLAHWAQDLQVLQAQLPAPQSSKTAGQAQPSATPTPTPTLQVPAAVPTVSTSTAPAAPQTLQGPGPAGSYRSPGICQRVAHDELVIHHGACVLRPAPIRYIGSVRPGDLQHRRRSASHEPRSVRRHSGFQPGQQLDRRSLRRRAGMGDRSGARTEPGDPRRQPSPAARDPAWQRVAGRRVAGIGRANQGIKGAVRYVRPATAKPERVRAKMASGRPDGDM